MNKIIKISLPFFFLLFISFASLPTMAQDNGELILTDYAYGKDSMQVMDISLAKDRSLHTPLIILVHGGGWMAGDKKDADFMRDICFSNGINVVNINYRLGSNKVHYKEMMKDIDSAIALLQKKADEWNIRKSKYIFWGGSAGAHLSLLYAYGYDKRNVISLVMTLGAPVKFDSSADMEGGKKSDLEGLLPIITGKPWVDNPQLVDKAYKKASPYYAKNLKPTFLVHGEKDDIVPKKQSEMLSQLLKQSNVADTLVILPNGGHGGENTPPEVSNRVNRAMYQWILRYSK